MMDRASSAQVSADILRLTSLCNRTGVPVLDQPQLIYILTEVAPGVAMSGQRMPLNFALVLDQSGSMAGDKLRTMKEAVKSIIDQLHPDDILSIIAFETRTHVLVPSQPATDKTALKRQVDLIRDGGGTNMAAGLREGLGLVRQKQAEGRVSRIVLLTDGEATDKDDDSRRIADEAGGNGIPIIGLGFGKDWKEDFLLDLADRSVLAVLSGHVTRVNSVAFSPDGLSQSNFVLARVPEGLGGGARRIYEDLKARILVRY